MSGSFAPSAMFDTFIDEITVFLQYAKYQLPTILLILSVLWGINLLNWYVLDSKLKAFGLVPRHLSGLIGILTMPILHGDFNHLFFNSIPLFTLGLYLLTFGTAAFIKVTVTIMVLAGLGTWLFGRHGNHIGASALINGYFGFILTMAYYRPSFTTIFIALIALYYFGGILVSVFPHKETTSWEGHLTGMIAGVCTLYLLRYNYFGFFS